ncbi:hypothetical protein LDENG_00153540 [Lucifuga dentata]|nr:hypothetical protein LDENG_00153540 [Lucifuga dentata]
MDTGHCLCLVAVAIYIYTALQIFIEGSRIRCWVVVFEVCAAIAAYGYYLFFSASPERCGLTLLCCSLCLYFICVSLKEDVMLRARGKAVLITGCDTGFGHALAQKLSDMEVKVFAGVLNINGSGAQQLRERRCENLEVLQLDVTDESQIEEAHRYISSQVGQAGLWGLVNNAGILHCPMDTEIQPITSFKLCMEVNFLGAVKMCQVFLPLLRRSRGRIVNITSSLGEIPAFSFSAYGGSKAALSAFSKAAKLELAKWGIKVAIIQPSGFKTNLFGNRRSIRLYKKKLLSNISPEVREDYGEKYISSLCKRVSEIPVQFPENLRPVVDAMCQALLSANPKPLYTPGQPEWPGWLLPFICYICPNYNDSLITQIVPTDCKPAGLQSS